MANLYLSYYENWTGGEPQDPSDRWTSYTDKTIIWRPERLFLNEPDALCTVVDIDGDATEGEIIHLVIVRYSSGNTFIRTHGEWCVEGAYRDLAEADEVLERLTQMSMMDMLSGRATSNDLKMPM